MNKIASYITAKNINKSTIKSIIKKVDKDKLEPEVDSQDITIWYDNDTEKKSRQLLKRIVKELKDRGGKISWQDNGSKIWLRWKGKFQDMGDWNDPSSRWHY